MNDKRKIEINIIEVQTYKILIQINSNLFRLMCSGAGYEFSTICKMEWNAR